MRKCLRCVKVLRWTVDGEVGRKVDRRSSFLNIPLARVPDAEENTKGRYTIEPVFVLV